MPEFINRLQQRISEGARYVFFLSSSDYDEKKGYIPCVAVENEPGYCPMGGNGEGAEPWYWGTDRAIAQKLCDKRNERMGYDKKTALTILASSMALSR